MLLYRIAHKKYAQNLSVSGLSGRWNSDGKMVLYTSENISLALLENMIYRAGTGFNDDYKIMIIEVLSKKLEQITVENLVKNWREQDAYPELQKIGDDWYEAQKNLMLKVPSSILPENFNVILNSIHPDFKKVKLIDVLDYEPDERLEKILKKYSK
ncbi:RES family NAD+ phosphorylase [Frigoriflavimonas asaccharolytica]|uniref:RES domain-containing protein n=1 Tax=Frigoriflavimonas asaccharolytica TaxID=2735899 RepID=A0A8J8G7Y4_9FLAO|nr:RES family NAD+ phosphorylase [Frigoriflavimonas asaccharolytica]NRS92828.1 RES domain-containing protein [Frigoriflavimonas asaccharolytica]